MNQWCLWRAQQLREIGLLDSAKEWEVRADSEPEPDPRFVWPVGYTRASAVARAREATPGLPADASDFWVLGALNTLLGSQTRQDARGGGGHGNPNHANDGKFASSGGTHHAGPGVGASGAGRAAGGSAAVSSSHAHAATAAATSPDGHQHAAALHEHAAAAHRAAGNGTMAGAHDMIAQHHKAEAASYGHSGPGHEHSARAMEATDKAYRSASGADHAAANHAAANAHDVASAVHSREGHTAAAAEHQRIADQHRSVIGTDMRMRPGAMSSAEAYKPKPKPEPYVPPVASAKAKAASKAASDAEISKGDHTTLSSYLEFSKLHAKAADLHGSGWEADFHRNMANDYHEIGTGKKPKPVYSKYR